MVGGVWGTRPNMPGPACAQARACFENMSVEEVKIPSTSKPSQERKARNQEIYLKSVDDVSCVISEESRVIPLEL